MKKEHSDRGKVEVTFICHARMGLSGIHVLCHPRLGLSGIHNIPEFPTETLGNDTVGMDSRCLLRQMPDVPE
jgi:hypothetical protein